MAFATFQIVRACLLAGLIGAMVGLGETRGEARLMPEPGAAITLASIDRTIDGWHRLAAARGEPRFSVQLNALLAKARQLRGLDRGRPLGLLLFFDPLDADASPAPLAFLPVRSVEDLRESVSATGNSLTPAESGDRYALRLGKDDLVLELAGETAWIARRKDADLLARCETLVPFTRPAGEAHDVALRILKRGLPPLALLRGFEQIAAESLRRPHVTEGDAADELRAAAHHVAVDWANLLLAGTQELRLGLSLSPEGGLTGAAELLASESSALGPLLDELLPPPARFAPNGDARAALALGFSLGVTEAGRTMWLKFLAAARKQIEAEQREQSEVAVRPAQKLFDMLEATLRQRRLEGRVQFLPVEPGPFALVGQLRVERGEEFAAALHDSGEAAPASWKAEPQPWQLVLDGIEFHRVPGQKARTRDVALYGRKAELYIAAEPRTLWLGVGGPQLDRALLTANRSTSTPEPPADTRAPAIWLEAKLDAWLRVSAAAERGGRGGPTPSLAGDGAANRVRVDITSTGSGLRMQLMAGEEAVRLLWRQFAPVGASQ